MALFIDGPVSTTEDLRAHDSQLPDVASTEGIDVTLKLALAKDDLGFDLERLLDGRQPLVKVAHTLAVQVWHTFRTLELVYRDAYFTHLNDRYKAKRDQFHELARDARDHLIHSGVPIVTNPLRRAAKPRLEEASPGVLEEGTYYVSMAWTNDAGEEGTAGPFEQITVATGAFFVTPAVTVEGATGWNVYVGIDAEHMTLQNAVPLAVDESWPQDASPTTNGRAPGTGQSPDFIQPIPRALRRG
jgi:hypothetical protein